jgi:hypothetical protein
MEIFSESYKAQKELEDKLFHKWESALEAEGGIADQHMARTTAILMENYMGYLKQNDGLINESISSGDFKGVNLALLGLIRRAIPQLVGSELVGLQAMPTPNAPIFYMSWRKSLANDRKGASLSGQELHGYPTAGAGVMEQIDPFLSSQQIRGALVKASPSSTTTYKIQSSWAPVINFTARFTVVDASNKVVGSAWVKEATPSTLAGVTSVYEASGELSAARLHVTGNHTVVNPDGSTSSVTASPLAPVFEVTTASIVTGVKVLAQWEYSQESNATAPEFGVQIDQFNVSLIRRMLKGKFSLDAMTDAQAYHGISLENEMMEIMKFELTNEINREIINDLRNMAAITNSIDYAANTITNTAGNYDDTFKLVLDMINGLSAEILSQTRMGRGNFVVANPVTLAFLDRVPGFVGSGVSYDGKGLSFAGSIGNRLKFYTDPQYVKNELLIGYKGASAIDTGYIHAPYLPITATPTLLNPETGDPSKIFYTRYGKTYRDFDATLGKASNAIYRGEYCYARAFLSNMPTI